ncbi:MAG: hypothetical protein M3018_13425, partial [Actinomycetota bacterium]|nr:hypothetical protein [Actinomycetota bacterium]
MHAIATSADRTAAIEEDGLAPGARVLAALAIVLARHHDRVTLALGYLAPAATAPLRVDLDLHEDPSFGELIELAREAIELSSPRDGVESSPLDAIVAADHDPPSAAAVPLW